MDEQAPLWKSRKYPKHFSFRPWQTNRTRIFFVTLCAHQRKPILAIPVVHALFDSEIRKARNWWVSRYLIMPDHIHMFCHLHMGEENGVEGIRLTQSLLSFIKFVKSRVSSRWPFPDQQPIWQRDFWDTELRDAEHFQSRWNYVRGNPVRKGLVREPEDWPYVGGMIPREVPMQHLMGR